MITQTLFKSKGGGQGFRRFQIDNKDHLSVVQVDDLVALQPFEGATNRTAVLALLKGEKTKAQVPYTVWTKKKGQDVSSDTAYVDVLKATSREELEARNIDPSDSTSAWITGNKQPLDTVARLVGASHYKARMGACFGSTGVFWVKVLSKVNSTVFMVQNSGGGKKHVKQVTASIESDLLYPILRGRDLKRWIGTPSLAVIMPQDQRKVSLPMTLREMKIKYPTLNWT